MNWRENAKEKKRERRKSIIKKEEMESI